MGGLSLKVGRRCGSLLTVVALVAGLVVVTSIVTPAPTANAATVNLGTIQAQMADHRGVDHNTSGNCIRYSPTTGTGASQPRPIP